MWRQIKRSDKSNVEVSDQRKSDKKKKTETSMTMEASMTTEAGGREDEHA